MPKLPRSYIDPQWSSRELDKAVDRLSSSDSAVSLEGVVQQLRTFSAEEQVEEWTESLASTLHTLAQAAKPGSKFSGVVVDYDTYRKQWRVQYDVSRAQEWVRTQIAKHLATLEPDDEVSAAIRVAADALRLQDRIDELREKAERRMREGNLSRASEILYGEIPALQNRLATSSGIYVEIGNDGERELLRGSDGSNWIAQRVRDTAIV